jgi:hypothetical protein
VSSLNLGDSFAAAVLDAAGLDTTAHDPSTLAIDYLPEGGRTTIRVSRVADVDTAQLRQIIADTAADQPSGF